MMLLWLSHQNVIGREAVNPSSFSSLCNQIASQVHLARALYSDSHEDLDVEFCLLDDHEIGVEPEVNK